jgi:hypothetical protein
MISIFIIPTGQLDSLKSELRITQMELLQATRGRAQLEGSLESLSSQVKAKEGVIDELKAQIEQMNLESASTKEEILQKKNEQLKAEVYLSQCCYVPATYLIINLFLTCWCHLFTLVSFMKSPFHHHCVTITF